MWRYIKRESKEKLSRNHQHDSMSEQIHKKQNQKNNIFLFAYSICFQWISSFFSAHHLASIATSRRHFGQQLQCFLPTALQAQLTNSPSQNKPKNSQTPSTPTNSKKTSKHLQFSNEKHHGKKPLKTHREKHDQKQRNPRIHQILWLVLEISFVLTWLLHNSTVNFWMTSLVFCFKCHLCHIICHRWNGDLILSRGSHFEPRTC